MKLRYRDLTAGTFEGEVVPKTTRRVFTSASLFRDATYCLVANFLMQYISFSGVLGPSEKEYKAQMGVINLLFIIFLIWDGINDPLFGFILEKVHLKGGKFRPWILIGGLLNAAAVALMFTVRPTGWAFVAWWGVIYFIWDGVFTLNDIAYWSMLPSLTSDEKIRSKLTTWMSIFISIGTAIMYVLCNVLPSAANYTYIYKYIAIPTCILFALSQLAIYFFCKEKKRDPKQEELSEKTHFKDLFIIFGKNKPLRMCVYSLLLYYTGGALLMGLGMTYFYLIYGYGGAFGGSVSTVIGVGFGAGMLISQILFGVLSNKFKKKKIMAISGLIALAAFVAFFFVGVPLFGKHPIAYNPDPFARGLKYALGGTMWMMYVPVIIMSSSIGIFYLALLVMLQNTIEYNEWKNGARKESVIFAWRPLSVKLAGALQKALNYAILAMTGVYGILAVISKAEMDLNYSIEIANKTPETAEKVIEEATQLCDTTINNHIANIDPAQNRALGICFVIVMLVCFVGAFLFMHFGYHIDEDKYKMIVDELEVRRAEDQKEYDKKNGVAQAEVEDVKCGFELVEKTPNITENTKVILDPDIPVDKLRKRKIRKRLKIQDAILFVIAGCALFWGYSTFLGAITNITVKSVEFYRVMPEFITMMMIVQIYVVNHLALYPQSEKSLRGTYKHNGWWIMVASVITIIWSIVHIGTGVEDGLLHSCIGPLHPLDSIIIPIFTFIIGYRFVIKERDMRVSDYKFDTLGNPKHRLKSTGMFFIGFAMLWSTGAVIDSLIANHMNWGNPNWGGPFILYLVLLSNLFIYLYYTFWIKEKNLNRKQLITRTAAIFGVAIIDLILTIIVFTAIDPDVVPHYMAWTFQMDLMTSVFVTAYFITLTPLLYTLPKLIRAIKSK